MNDHDELIRRIRARAAEESEALPACADAPAVAEAEQALGFALPPLLVRLYREVANGGFGPDYEVFPLVGEGRTAVSGYASECPAPPAEPAPHWPRGVLPILDWGCGMYAAVDCLQPHAPVLLFEPNAVKDDWTHAWFRDAPSLAEWLDSWLDGTGWWDQEAASAEGSSGPVAWPAAAERLAARS